MTNFVKNAVGPDSGLREGWDIFRDAFSPQTFPGAIFYGVLIGLLAWLGGRAVRVAVHRVLEKDSQGALDPTTVQFLGKLSKLLVWIFAFLSYAHIVPALQKLGTAWLASVGVVSVVVGLAAQSTLGNLISGISLVLYRPFKIGDVLQVSAPSGTVTATVESINLGYTVLRTDDNRLLVMPNSLIASQTCINMSQTKPVCVITIKLSHDADPDKARKILIDIAAQHANSAAAPSCRMTSLTPAGVAVTLTAWPKNGGKSDEMTSDILEAAKRQFDAGGIGFQRDDLAAGGC